MKPQRQTVFGGGANGSEPGNCFAACVATVLGLDLVQVPNFVAVPADASWWLPFERWCAERNVWPLWLEASAISGSFDLVVIANGEGPRGLRHSVVWRDDSMLWDPHPSDEGLVGDPDAFVILAQQDPSRSHCSEL